MKKGFFFTLLLFILVLVTSCNNEPNEEIIQTLSSKKVKAYSKEINKTLKNWINLINESKYIEFVENYRIPSILQYEKNSGDFEDTIEDFGLDNGWNEIITEFKKVLQETPIVNQEYLSFSNSNVRLCKINGKWHQYLEIPKNEQKAPQNKKKRNLESSNSNLSQYTINTITAIKDPVTIKAYFSTNLPGEFVNTRRYAQKLLSEYQTFSQGKLSYEFFDIKNDESLKEEARKNNITPLTMRVLENNQLVIKEVYLGLAFLFKNKIEAFTLTQNAQGLEYNITIAIKKITDIGLKKVAIFSNDEQISSPHQNKPTTIDNFKQIRTLISECYDIVRIDLTSEIDNSVNALLFTGVNDSLTLAQLYNLDQFIMIGGNILFFQDRISADVKTQKAEQIHSNLFVLLKHYGINITNNLVADAECGMVQVQQLKEGIRTTTSVNYPLFPIIHKVNKKNQIVKNLDQLQLIYASEIDTTSLNESLSFEPLLYTSKNSGEIVGPKLDISIKQYMNQNLNRMFNGGEKVVAGVYSGLFKSYFADNPDYPVVSLENSDANILLVADSEFVEDLGGAGIKGNLDLLLNALNYLCNDNELINLRNK